MRLRWNWGTGIALVYAVFAAATMGFVAFAMGQKVELVSEDYYQVGLEHDGRMAAAAGGASLGDAIRIEILAAERAATIVWTEARPRRGDGTVTFYRPSDATVDRVVPVDPDPTGRQWISLAGAPSGRWIARVSWRAGDREYFVERAVTTP
jgi:nitrogen fixation protein FixH